MINQNLNKEDLLLTGAKHFDISEKDINGEICQIANLGSEVSDGTFVKYLITLRNEGDSVTYKMFTIDRQDISGIKAYLVQQVNSGNSIFYSYATYANNSRVEISNSVTDGIAALTWDKKASGSEIFASYSYTPFTINNEDGSIINTITLKYGNEINIEDTPIQYDDDILRLLKQAVAYGEARYLHPDGRLGNFGEGRLDTFG